MVQEHSTGRAEVQNNAVAKQGALAHAGLPETFDLTQLREHEPSTAPSSKHKACRRTYAAKVGYYGPAFPNGWAWASHLEGTAQALVQQVLAVALNVAPGQQVSTCGPHVCAAKDSTQGLEAWHRMHLILLLYACTVR